MPGTASRIICSSTIEIVMSRIAERLLVVTLGWRQWELGLWFCYLPCASFCSVLLVVLIGPPCATMGISRRWAYNTQCGGQPPESQSDWLRWRCSRHFATNTPFQSISKPNQFHDCCVGLFISSSLRRTLLVQ